MADGLDELNRTIARFEHARDELDAKIREAHAATKDARQAQRDLEALIETTIPEKAHALMDKVVSAELSKLLDQVVDGMHTTEARITKRFDTIAGILMGEDKSQRRKGKPTIEQLAKHAAARRG